jgi:hypothetical protein
VAISYPMPYPHVHDRAKLAEYLLQLLRSFPVATLVLWITIVPTIPAIWCLVSRVKCYIVRGGEGGAQHKKAAVRLRERDREERGRQRADMCS